MGGSKPKPPPPPTIVYAPPPPPPTVTQAPSQSLQTQTALNEVSGKQTRLNMELGAKLDRTNAEFFAGQDIRRTKATAAEQRLTQKAQYGLETDLTRVRGQEDRAQTVETGAQYREGLRTAGKETRATDLQREMFRRYKENRDYEQAQRQYRA